MNLGPELGWDTAGLHNNVNQPSDVSGLASNFWSQHSMLSPKPHPIITLTWITLYLHHLWCCLGATSYATPIHTSASETQQTLISVLMWPSCWLFDPYFDYLWLNDPGPKLIQFYESKWWSTQRNKIKQGKYANMQPPCLLMCIDSGITITTQDIGSVSKVQEQWSRAGNQHHPEPSDGEGVVHWTLSSLVVYPQFGQG